VQAQRRCSGGGVPSTVSSGRPEELRRTLESTGFKFWCDVCGVGFAKRKNLEMHSAGKKHRQALAEKSTAWDSYAEAAPTWARLGADGVNVETRWSVLDDLSGFPMRATCLSPSATLGTLQPSQRGRFFRYLKDVFGAHYPELPAIFHWIDANGGARYLRVKEIFESLEAFRAVSAFVQSAKEQGMEVDTIWDLACGHGLVGILLAYRFPGKRVICIDLEYRPAFEAYMSGWRAVGDKQAGWAQPLQNVEFWEQDLLEAFAPAAGTSHLRVSEKDLVIALHACNEANMDVVEGARAAGALWAVMPCCIRSDLYLSSCRMDLDDDTRFVLLSGAFANEYGAQVVRTIDRRITARPILLAGGLHQPLAGPRLGAARAARTSMPPRQLVHFDQGA